MKVPEPPYPGAPHATLIASRTPHKSTQGRYRSVAGHVRGVEVEKLQDMNYGKKKLPRVSTIGKVRVWSPLGIHTGTP